MPVRIALQRLQARLPQYDPAAIEFLLSESPEGVEFGAVGSLRNSSDPLEHAIKEGGSSQLAALALGVLANRDRLAYSFSSSAGRISSAYAWAFDEVLDRRVFHWLFFWQAALEFTLGRHSTALTLARYAGVAAANSQETAQALVLMANATWATGEPAAAAILAKKSMALGLNTGPYRQTLALFLAEAGDGVGACQQMASLAPPVDDQDRAQRAWVRGLIHLADEGTEAEAYLEAAAHLYGLLEDPVQLALVTVDLARCRLRRGLSVEDLGSGAAQILVSLGVPEQAAFGLQSLHLEADLLALRVRLAASLTASTAALHRLAS